MIISLGMDMANAFMVHITNAEWAAKVRSVIELGVREEEDDEFAAIYGLV